MKSLLALIILLTIALSISACTIPPPPGVSAQDFARCRFEASRRDGVAWPDEVNLCLSGMGY
jgi:hypothetical protein